MSSEARNNIELSFFFLENILISANMSNIGFDIFLIYNFITFTRLQKQVYCMFSYRLKIISNTGTAKFKIIGTCNIENVL